MASRRVAFGSEGDRGGLPGPTVVQTRATALRVAIPAGMLIAYVRIRQPTMLRALAMVFRGTAGRCDRNSRVACHAVVHGGTTRHRLARDCATRRTAVAHDAARGAQPGRVRVRALRAERANLGVPGLPAAGRLAGGGRSTKRRAFADQEYWGRPVPGFGVDRPAVVIVGLAPAAHGANRTGRNFTGDRSGQWLYAALYRCGLANQPTAVAADDGLALVGTRIVAKRPLRPLPRTGPRPRSGMRAARGWCASCVSSGPTCGPWSCSADSPGQTCGRRLRMAGVSVPDRVPPFAHGLEVPVDGRTVLGCYHVSQQNTFTGRLTEPMLDAVLGRAVLLAGGLASLEV